MAIEDIIAQILQKRSDVTRQQILDSLQAEKTKSGGLFEDETLMRYIAAQYGVQIIFNQTFHSSLSIGHLFAGLYDVTLKCRVLAVFPVKTFEGEKPGKFATLLVSDEDGMLRVILWNEKADAVEKGELKPGQIVLLSHGYTKNDRVGKTELHMSSKSKIELQPNENPQEYLTLEKFATKISELSPTSSNSIIAGEVKEPSSLSSFQKSDGVDGMFLRFTLKDESGTIKVVAWNEKASELEKTLRPNAKVQIVNGRIKDLQNGVFEMHVDSNVQVNVQPPIIQTTKLSSLSMLSGDVNVEGQVSALLENKNVVTGKGETIKLLVFNLKDDSAEIRVSVWREQAEQLKDLKVGDRVVLENIFVKKGLKEKIELSTKNVTLVRVTSI
jgi:ssDNA-binding replication factor A large subunit